MSTSEEAVISEGTETEVSPDAPSKMDDSENTEALPTGEKKDLTETDEVPAEGVDQHNEVDEEEIVEEEYDEEEVIDDDDEEYEEEEVFEEDDEIIEEEIVDDDGVAVEQSIEGEETAVSNTEGGEQNTSLQDETVQGSSEAQEVTAEESETSASAAQSSEAVPSGTEERNEETSTEEATNQVDPEDATDYAQFHPPVDTDAEQGFSEQPGGDDMFTDEVEETDIENQQVSPSPADSPTQVATETYERGTTAVEKDGQETSCIWYVLACLVVGGLLGGGAYIGYFLVTENRKDAPSLGEDDDFTAAPSAAPTVGFTTPFDPIQGNCDFMDLKNPHVIDQCACVGEIQIIADDVRARYDSHRADFIPKLYETYNDRIDSCSPRNQALVWISSANDFEYEFDERIERFALATMYAGLKGASWRNSENWLNEDSICTWGGVLCRSDEMVEVLTFSGNNLIGTMPPEIGLLDHMLSLFASRNEIEGPIPEALFAIPELQVVDLSSNSLSGPVPPAIGSADFLREIYLESNNLSGRLSQQLGNASNLEILNIGGNDLVGSLPIEIFNLTNLVRFDLGDNTLTGNIPSEIANLQNLTTLVLGPNAFFGEVPTAIGEITSLEVLTLRGLPLLGGRLPAVFGRNLKNLVDLTITGTNIDGNIETDFGDLPNLVRLDLSRNSLRGSIPMELGNLGNLTVLDLSNNFLDGAIPVSLGGLAKATELILNDNILRESVPNQFAALTTLQTLRLDGNQVSGRVAQEVCDLRGDAGALSTFIVDCFSEISDGVTSGVVCDIPDCCTGCRT